MKDHRTRTGGYVQRSTAPDAGSVGKRTQVDKVQRRRVQQSAAPAADGAAAEPAGVHEAAAHGTSGAGGPMPFGDQIQGAFGRHDISGVQAHTGQAAQEGAAAMGANAFATGDQVAFAGAPDLHTAAHEAAHTVQQKSGVQLSGGVGAVGDAYEQQADQVADAVVAGKSAEGLLDAGPGGGGGGDAGVQKAVQRDPNTAKSDGPSQQLDFKSGKGEVKDPSPAINKDSVKDPFHHPYWPQFLARVQSLFNTIGAPPDGAEPSMIARQLWSGVCSGMEDGQKGMQDKAAYKDQDKAKGWLDMESGKMQEVIGGFDGAMEKLRGYTSSTFATAKSFGFWSGPAGKALSEHLCDVTLETSAIGSLFDKIPSLDGEWPKGWDPQLWAALSRAYATSVGNEIKKKGKKAHICVGPGAKPGNIFDTVESLAIKKQIEPAGRKLTEVCRFHAAATPKGDTEKVDYTVKGPTGDFPGCVWSGTDLQTARDKATEHADSHKTPK